MQQSLSNTVSFKNFLTNDKRSKIILWITLAAILIQLSIFKYFYPFASYIHGDSFVYINAAAKNLSINTYPIGYSKFLRLVSVFSSSDTFLVCLQYILLQFSLLFLFFSILYLFAIKTI